MFAAMNATVRPHHSVSRIEILEARIAPATLDVTGGVLTYTAGNAIANALAVAIAGANYSFNDTGETITLTANATAAGFTGGGTNTVLGPNTAVTSISVNLGDQSDQLIIQGLADPFTMNDGAGTDGVFVTGSLNVGGALQLAGETIDVTAAIGGATTATLIANAISLASTITASTRVTLQPLSAVADINLGAADSAGVLGLTDAELDRITAPILQIGVAAGAIDIIVSAAITPANASTLLLVSTGTITDTGAGSIVVPNLAISSKGSVTLDSASNDIGTLAASVTNSGASFSFRDTDDVIVGTLDGIVGLSVSVANTADTISLEAGATTQTAGAKITGPQLVLQGAGPFTLNERTNDVATIAADVTGAISYTDADTTSVGTVAGVMGVTTSNSPIFLSVVGNGGLTVQSTGAAGSDVDAGTSTVTLVSGATGLDLPLTINAGASVFGSGGVNLTADSMSIGGIADAGTAIATLKPFEDLTTVNVGGADAAATLGLTDSELDFIIAGTLAISTTGGGAGPVNVTAPVTPANAPDFTLIANTIAINSTVTITGVATIAPFSAGRDFDLGTKSAGNLGVTDTELDRITANVIRIGSATAGNLIVSAAINAVGTGTLALLSGGNISASGGTITETRLRLDAAGSATLTGSNNVTRLASNTGTLQFSNGVNPLIIATADGTTGLTANGSSISLFVDALDIQQPIAAGGGVQFLVLTSGRQTNLGTATGGFDLTDAELDLVTATEIVVGRTNAGAINVSSPISIANSPALVLLTGAGVSGAGSVTVANLSISAKDDVTLAGANRVTNFAAEAPGAGHDVSFTSLDPLTLNTLSLASGITLGGTLSLTAPEIDQTAAIIQEATGGAVTITATSAAGIELTNAANNFTGAVTFVNPGVTSVTDTVNLVLAPQSIAATLSIKSGGAVTQTGPFTGAGGLTFTGPGTLTLDQANTYAGATDITAGTLQGTGVPGPLTVNGGTLAPGTSPAIFTAGGNVSINGASTVAIEITGLTAGTQHDQLAVTGSVTLAGTLQVTDTFLAADQNKFVIISNDATDAVTGTFTGLPEGAIVNGGARFFKISYAGGDGNDVELTALVPTVTPLPGGKSVTFTDADGDLVTVKTTAGTFTGNEFRLIPAGGAIGGSVLGEVDLGAGFKGAKVTISAKRGAVGGNGFANVGYLNAIGVDLGAVVINGDLGRIDAGAVKALTVQSLGALGVTTQLGAGTLVSHFTGALGKLTVKSSIQGATLLGSSSIGAVNVLGSFLGGQLSAGADIGSVSVRGDIVGTAAAPVVISAFGKAIAPTKGIDLAIKSLKVAGDVNFLRVLAGYDTALAGMNADAAIGTISVGADWRASTVLAGVKAGIDGFDGTADDAKLSGGGVRDVATIFSQIASITIKGQAFGTIAAGDSFGIVAEQIGKAKLGAATLKLDKGERDAADKFALAPTGPGPAPDNATSDFFLRESVV